MHKMSLLPTTWNQMAVMHKNGVDVQRDTARSQSSNKYFKQNLVDLHSRTAGSSAAVPLSHQSAFSHLELHCFKLPRRCSHYGENGGNDDGHVHNDVM